jgi:ABC-type transport system involved in cytochrome c biogenesis permease subunit
MFCGVPLGEEGQQFAAIFLILVPASFYIMGLMEGKTGYALFLTGIAVHGVTIVLRGCLVHAIPLTEKYDNISFLAFAMALVYWFYSQKKGLRELGLFALPLISVILIAALAYMPINSISPFQRTPWFTLHIFFFFVSYALFGISSCIGLLYLVRKETSLEPVQYDSGVAGWIALSLALVTGSIWFFMAYGTYWLWTSKELWTTLLWFYYGMYLHARYVKGLTGRWAAVIGIAGFPVALFAYFGVGTIIPAPPTQF